MSACCPHINFKHEEHTCLPLGGGIHLRRHVDQRDVKEHSACDGKDVFVGRLRLANQDSDDEPDVARAGRQKIVTHRLNDKENGHVQGDEKKVQREAQRDFFWKCVEFPKFIRGVGL